MSCLGLAGLTGLVLPRLGRVREGRGGEGGGGRIGGGWHMRLVCTLAAPNCCRRSASARQQQSSTTLQRTASQSQSQSQSVCIVVTALLFFFFAPYRPLRCRFPPITIAQPPVPKAPHPSAQREEREGERVDPVAVRRITPFVRPQINPDQLPPDYLVRSVGTYTSISLGGLCLVAVMSRCGCFTWSSHIKSTRYLTR